MSRQVHARCSTVFAWRAVPVVLLPAVLQAVAIAAPVRWDFSQGRQGWSGNPGVLSMEVTAEGLVVRTSDDDPWIEGPPVDLPGAKVTKVTVRMKSEHNESAELFYGRGFSAERSVRFVVLGGDWRRYELIIPYVLGPGTRFRLDPCVRAATVTIASITVESVGEVESPRFAAPRPPDAGGRQVMAASGTLTCEQDPKRWGGWVVSVDDVQMAVGYDHDLIGVLLDGKAHYIDLGQGAIEATGRDGNTDSITSTVADPGGALWRVVRHVQPGDAGTIHMEVSITVDKDREAVHLPWMTLFPGLGSFGQRKTQAVFPGLEYLDDEPSSSTADIEGPEHIRRIPDPVKITLPMMALLHGGRYVGVVWEPSELVAATFDSPDTLYGTGAHVMALSGPGIGPRRFANALNAHSPIRFEAGKPLAVRFAIIGGPGQSVVEAVRHYVRLRGLPPLPHFDGGFERAVELLAHGWLDSKINEGGLFRHAVWGESFRPQAAADAAMYIDYLAHHAGDPDLRRRLTGLRDLGLSKIAAGDPYTSSVSHARLLSAPFIFGRMPEFAARARRSAEGELRRFDDQGLIRYRPGDVDYGRTHFADHANGLSGRALVAVLEGAALSADAGLIEQALALLDKQTTAYANAVPRGAQTWECPLHTPDILASAHMVKAYTLGYIISGRQPYLEQARYWAWTGVPFVYLVNPTDTLPIEVAALPSGVAAFRAAKGRAPASDRTTGPYATIAVLCATNWRAPVWFGQPVQWCGLVYASSLQLLAQYDTEGPWKQIADGITLSGLRQTWTESDAARQGLLPDYFLLRPQISEGPAINPGTVQAHLPEAFNKGRLYDLKKVPGRDWFIHAPCAIDHVETTADMVAFITTGWGDKPYHVLVAGVRDKPKTVFATHPLRSNRQPADYQHNPDTAALILTVKGPTSVVIH